MANLTTNALAVLRARYLIKNEEGKAIETPEQLFRRVSHHIAQAEIKFGADDRKAHEIEQKIYSMLDSLEFVPNSPTLMNAGRKLGQLSACFTLPVDDSLDSIFETVKDTALIQKSGGGTGFSFSRLRPEGDFILTTDGKASGPVIFMAAFNEVTEVVKQGGKRRGANMGVLRADHPDIIKFINSKGELDGKNLKIYNAILSTLGGDANPAALEYIKQVLLDTQNANFNISVAATDKFMEAVEKGQGYELINPRSKEATGSLNAKYVFDLIGEMAWRTGDPGMIFIDRINRTESNPILGWEIESTNPCGELPLYPYDSCNLGSINVARFLKDGKIDYNSLGETVDLCVRFLDNVIEMNKYPIPQIAEITNNIRRIGLGIMGFADLLYTLRIPYDSNEALMIGEDIMQFINERGKKASENLANERDPFPLWERSIYANKRKLRNSTVTTIAPTGTISMIAGCSSGIEPIFALAFKRQHAPDIGDGGKLEEPLHHIFKQAAIDAGFYSNDLVNIIVKNGGSIQHLDFIPKEIRDVFVVSHDIAPVWHVKMQAAFQKHVDNAVSKTINLPNSATAEDIKDIYLSSYKLGCKGITVFRDGCKTTQVFAVKKK